MMASFGLSDAKVPRMNEEAVSLGERSVSSFILGELVSGGLSLKRVLLFMAGCNSVSRSEFIISLSNDQKLRSN